MPRTTRQCAQCKCIAVYRVAVIKMYMDRGKRYDEEIDVQKLCPEHWAGFVAEAVANGYSAGISPLYRKPS